MLSLAQLIDTMHNICKVKLSDEKKRIGQSLFFVVMEIFVTHVLRF